MNTWPFTNAQKEGGMKGEKDTGVQAQPQVTRIQDASLNEHFLGCREFQDTG